jgi:hypothetical protein
MCRSGEWSPYDVCVDEAEKEEMKRIVNLCKENASHIGQVRSLLGNNLTILTFVERARAPNPTAGEAGPVTATFSSKKRRTDE